MTRKRPFVKPEVIKMNSFNRLVCCPLTNFTNVLNKTFFKFHEPQRVLIHFTLFSRGPEPEIKFGSFLPSSNEKRIKLKESCLNFEDVTYSVETDRVVVLKEIKKENKFSEKQIRSFFSFIKRNEKDKENDVSSKETTLSKESQTSSNGNNTGGLTTILVKMPSLSPTMTEGTIVNWAVKEGSVIAPGDLLCDIQTDKAIMSLESEEDGILAKILVPANTANVKVGTTIALIVPEGKDWKNVEIPSSETVSKEMLDKQQQQQQQPQPAHHSNGSSDVKSKRYGPAVKALLSLYQIQSGFIKPSGKGNRILKEDVLKYVMDNNLQKKPPMALPLPFSKSKLTEKLSVETEVKFQNIVPSSARPKFTDIQISNMRQVIAKRLVQSKKEIPSAYVLTKCNVLSLLNVKDNLAKEGVQVSMNDLITKTTASALNIYPKANSLCQNDRVTVSNDIDICIAVATDNGLFTPIVKSTNSKSLQAISREIRELGSKAKAGKLKPEEFVGGTFTISNLGMYGITHFKAIINPPQCGILAVGTILTDFDSELKIQKHINLTLSYDRRAMDELEAAEFMNTLKYLIENPKLILIENQKSLAIDL